MLLPGSFGIRAVAHIVDLLITTFIAFIAGALGGILVAMLALSGIVGAGWQERMGKPSVGTFVFGLVASVAYHAIGEGLGGASLGKLICGLRVITEDRRPCTFLKALGRSLAYYIDALFFGLVAWSSMSKSPMMQRYGDRWAGTIVVLARTMPATAARGPALGIIAGVGVYGFIQVVALVLKVM